MFGSLIPVHNFVAAFIGNLLFDFRGGVIIAAEKNSLVFYKVATKFVALFLNLFCQKSYSCIVPSSRNGP